MFTNKHPKFNDQSIQLSFIQNYGKTKHCATEKLLVNSFEQLSPGLLVRHIGPTYLAGLILVGPRRESSSFRKYSPFVCSSNASDKVFQFCLVLSRRSRVFYRKSLSVLTMHVAPIVLMGSVKCLSWVFRSANTYFLGRF